MSDLLDIQSNMVLPGLPATTGSLRAEYLTAATKHPVPNVKINTYIKSISAQKRDELQHIVYLYGS